MLVKNRKSGQIALEADKSLKLWIEQQMNSGCLKLGCQQVLAIYSCFDWIMSVAFKNGFELKSVSICSHTYQIRTFHVFTNVHPCDLVHHHQSFLFPHIIIIMLLVSMFSVKIVLSWVHCGICSVHLTNQDIMPKNNIAACYKNIHSQRCQTGFSLLLCV